MSRRCEHECYLIEYNRNGDAVRAVCETCPASTEDLEFDIDVDGRPDVRPVW